MGKTIGIDLGTTNSVVAIEENGHVRILENAAGNRTTPSVVSFKDGEIIIGEAAKRQAITNPNTIISVKRFMGTDKVFNIENKEYKPEQISAMILEYLKNSAEDKLGEKITSAIVTVPAYFNDKQRQATKDAGKIAGLNIERIINEPTAAALAYGIDSNIKNEIVLVYDLGGGTFDVSVLQLKDDVFEVLSTSGNNELGGDDFDQKIIDWVIEEFEKTNGIDLNSDKMAMQRLKEEAERAKKNLSTVNETTISLPFIINNDKNPLHIEQVITREKFESLVQELVDLTVEPVTSALNDAGVTPEEINEVLLVGGSTRIPLVRKLIVETFKKEPNATVNPDEVVAVGAAYQASLISGSITDIVLLDITPLTLGVETQGGVMTPLILRNTTIPTSKTLVFTTVEENQKVAEFKIFQGERLLTKDNKFLGDLIIDDLVEGPLGTVKITTTFAIDENGIVKITVKDEQTQTVKNMILEDATSLSDSELEKLIADADKSRKADEELKKAIELANIGQRKRIAIEKLIRELMTKNVNKDVIFSYQEFSREYEYAISSKNVLKLENYNKKSNEIIEKLEMILLNPTQANVLDKSNYKDNNLEQKAEEVEQPKEEPKVEEAKAEEPKVEEVKAEEPKVEEAKVEEPKEAFILEEEDSSNKEDSKEEAEESKVDNNTQAAMIFPEEPVEEVKAEEPKVEEAKAEETKAEEPKVEETKTEEASKEEPKVEEAKAEKNADNLAKEEASKEEPKVEEVKAEETKEEAKTSNKEEKKDLDSKKERPQSKESKEFKDAQAKKSTNRVKNEELEILRKELDSLRLKNLELFEEMEDIKKEEK